METDSLVLWPNRRLAKLLCESLGAIETRRGKTPAGIVGSPAEHFASILVERQPRNACGFGSMGFQSTARSRREELAQLRHGSLADSCFWKRDDIVRPSRPGVRGARLEVADLLATEHAGAEQQAEGRRWQADEELAAVLVLLVCDIRPGGLGRRD